MGEFAQPTGIQFELQEIRQLADKEKFESCYDTWTEIIPELSRDINVARNMVVVSCKPRDGILGWTSFPWSYPEDDKRHAIFISYESIPGGTLFPFDEGDTLVHEAGHYFGLYHTFEGKVCGGPGDYIYD